MPTPKTNNIGLTDAAKRFVRHFTATFDDDDCERVPGHFDEDVKLMVLYPRNEQSHIRCVRERAQKVQRFQSGTYIFTYLEAEYKCGCTEDMFRWREDVPLPEGFFNSARGLLWIVP